jgi:hypothetical protein
MRRIGIVLALVGLAGCVQPTGETAGEREGVQRAAQQQACAVAVANHIGKPVEAVSSVWDHATPDGGAVVTVTDTTPGGTDRVHDCEVDAAAQVHALIHPGT